MLNMLNMHHNTVKIGQISGTNQKKIKFLNKTNKQTNKQKGRDQKKKREEMKSCFCLTNIKSNL